MAVNHNCRDQQDDKGGNSGDPEGPIWRIIPANARDRLCDRQVEKMRNLIQGSPVLRHIRSRNSRVKGQNLAGKLNLIIRASCPVVKQKGLGLDFFLFWHDLPLLLGLDSDGVNEIFWKQNRQWPLPFSFFRNVQAIKDSVRDEFAGDEVRL